MKSFLRVLLAFFYLLSTGQATEQARRLKEELQFLESSSEDLEITLPPTSPSLATQEENTFWEIVPEKTMVVDEVGHSLAGRQKKEAHPEIPDDIDLNSIERKWTDSELPAPSKRTRRR